MARQIGSRRRSCQQKRLQGPWRVIATYQDAEEEIGAEVPRIEWQHDTELIEKSLFSLPEVNAEAIGYENGPGAYRRTIERAVEDGDPYDSDDETERDFVDLFPPLLFPWANRVFVELTRGQTDYQEAYEVVRRVRVASWKYPFGRQKISARLVYTTAQLGIPLDIVTGFTLPEALTNTIVGWRLRSQSYSLDAERRIETIEFVLAAWSTIAYSASGGNFS
jgi:hypothetical protein